MDVIILAGTHMAGCTGLRKQILAGRGALTAAGVHVPSAYDDHANSWHNLAWEIGGDRRFDPARGTLEQSFGEASEKEARVLLLMSEEFETAAMDPETSARITGLGEKAGGQVLVRLLFRHQVSYLNLVFAFRAINGLHGTWFEDFVRSPVPAEQFDYHDVIARFRQDPEVDARALSLQEAVAGGGLPWILESAGISVKRLPVGDLDIEWPPTSMRVLTSLMAHRLLVGRGHAPSDRATRQRVKQTAAELAKRFPPAGPYWGWTQRLLDEWSPQFEAANERFAQYHGVALEPDARPDNATDPHIREAEPALIKDLIENLNRMSLDDWTDQAEEPETA